jgi:hypothetical protein
MTANSERGIEKQKNKIDNPIGIDVSSCNFLNVALVIHHIIVDSIRGIIIY